jgi:hypothetical protein
LQVQTNFDATIIHQQAPFWRSCRGTSEGPKQRTREGGGSEWELIKILLEGDGNSNKMNTASNTHLRLKYPSWPRPRSHWSATGPKHTTYRTKTLEHTQWKLARLAACAIPVRSMACAGQTGGQSRSGWCLQQPHNKCSWKPQ